MLCQIIHGLRHLFQIEHAGPPRIPRALPGLELCLNIHQQIHLRQICAVDIFCAGRMGLFPGEGSQQFRQIISLPHAMGV